MTLALQAFLLAAGTACVRTPVILKIEIRGEHSLQGKIRIGNLINTPERTERLRSQVKARFPDLTPDDLSLLFIGWDSGAANVPESDRTVVVEVGMLYHPTLNRRAIVRYARDLLKPEVEALAAGPDPP